MENPVFMFCCYLLMFLTYLILSCNCHSAVFLIFPTVCPETVDRGFTVLVNVTIRWGICAGVTGRMQASHIRVESCLYFFRCAIGGNVEQEYNTDCSYKLFNSLQGSPWGCLQFICEAITVYSQHYMVFIEE